MSDFNTFVVSLHPAQQRRLGIMTLTMTTNRIDRADHELCNTIADCVAHLSNVQVATLWEFFTDQEKERFIWLVSCVCSVDTVAQVIRWTIRQDEIDKHADHKLVSILVKIREHDSAVTERETALHFKELELKARETSYNNAIAELRRFSARVDSMIDQL